MTRNLSFYLSYPSYKIYIADSKHVVRKYLYALSGKTDPLGKNDIEVYSVLKVTPNINSTEASKGQDLTSVKSMEANNGQGCIETSKSQDSKSDKSPHYMHYQYSRVFGASQELCLPHGRSPRTEEDCRKSIVVLRGRVGFFIWGILLPTPKDYQSH